MAKEKKDKKAKKGKDEAAEAPTEGAEGQPPVEGAEGAPAEGEGTKKKGLPLVGALPPALQLPVLIGAPVLLILLIVLGLFLGGVFSPKKVAKKACDQTQADCTPDQTEDTGTGDDKKADANAKPVYYNLPDMLVNLDSRGRKQSVLKMSVTLELGSPEDEKAMEDKMPRVVDEFQVFLREIRIEDLRGSAGIYRLRQELLTRIKPAVAPIKVKDVLFKELLIQ